MADLIQIYASLPLFPSLILVLFSGFYIVPLWISIIGYKRTNSGDYLIFSAMFVAYAIQLHSTPIFTFAINDFFSTGQTDYWTLNVLMIINTVCVQSWTFLTFLHVIRLRWDKAPRFIWVTGLILPLYAIISAVYAAFPETHSAFVFIPFSDITLDNLLDAIIQPLPAQEISRTFAFLLLIFAYLTVRPGHTSKRITAVRGIWISIGVNNVIIGLVTLFSVFFPTEFAGIGGLSEAYYVFLAILVMIHVLEIFLLGVLFPETMLISESQILRACKLYVKVVVHEEDRSKYRFGMQHLYDYVKNIPEEVFEECGEEPTVGVRQ